MTFIFKDNIYVQKLFVCLKDGTNKYYKQMNTLLLDFLFLFARPRLICASPEFTIEIISLSTVV